MPSYLILNSPRRDTVPGSWSFSDADDRALRACFDRLEAFRTTAFDDRSTAAIVYGFLDRSDGRVIAQEERAWTIEGAKTLAGLLPARLAYLRADFEEHFASLPASSS